MSLALIITMLSFFYITNEQSDIINNSVEKLMKVERFLSLK